MLKLKNGYYVRKDKYYPRVTTLVNCVGDSSGLIQWAAGRGGQAVASEILKTPEILDSAEQIGETKTGKPIYSVQNISTWAEEIGKAGYKAELTRTGDIGSELHEIFEHAIKGTEINVSDRPSVIKKGSETIFQFLKEAQFKDILVEDYVFSDQYFFAGKCDLFAKVKASNIVSYLSQKSEVADGNYIIDLKTGSLMRNKLIMQLGAYAQGIQESYGHQVDGGLVFSLKRENPSELVVYSYTKEDLAEGLEMINYARKAWFYIQAPEWFKQQFKKGTNNE